MWDADREAANHVISGQEVLHPRGLLSRAPRPRKPNTLFSQMEMLKSCIADQLRTIQENEDRAMDRVRRSKHVLGKGEGTDKAESMKRVRSSPSLRRNKVNRKSIGLVRCFVVFPCLSEVPRSPSPRDGKRIENQQLHTS